MSYGLSIHTGSGSLTTQFDRPIVALRTKYITTTSGSVNIPGAYLHAKVTIMPFYSINSAVAGLSGPPNIVVTPDDNVVWSPLTIGYVTMSPCIIFAYFYK